MATAVAVASHRLQHRHHLRAIPRSEPAFTQTRTQDLRLLQRKLRHVPRIQDLLPQQRRNDVNNKKVTTPTTTTKQRQQHEARAIHDTYSENFATSYGYKIYDYHSDNFATPHECKTYDYYSENFADALLHHDK